MLRTSIPLILVILLIGNSIHTCVSNAEETAPKGPQESATGTTNQNGSVSEPPKENPNNTSEHEKDNGTQKVNDQNKPVTPTGATVPEGATQSSVQPSDAAKTAAPTTEKPSVNTVTEAPPASKGNTPDVPKDKTDAPKDKTDVPKDKSDEKPPAQGDSVAPENENKNSATPNGTQGADATSPSAATSTTPLTPSSTGTETNNTNSNVSTPSTESASSLSTSEPTSAPVTESTKATTSISSTSTPTVGTKATESPLPPTTASTAEGTSSTTGTTNSTDTVGTSSKKEEAASITDKKEEEDTGMPSGLVALVTMIVLGVVVVVAYVGLIGWRRYLEYRYGNRELLVNDLEFDTNDLRHFEL